MLKINNAKYTKRRFNMPNKKIEFFVRDLKPEKQKELVKFYGGDSSVLEKTPFCTLKSDIDAESSGSNTQDVRL